MRILTVFIDMLRTDMLNIYDSSKPETVIDFFLKNLEENYMIMYGSHVLIQQDLYHLFGQECLVMRTDVIREENIQQFF